MDVWDALHIGSAGQGIIYLENWQPLNTVLNEPHCQAKGAAY